MLKRRSLVLSVLLQYTFFSFMSFFGKTSKKYSLNILVKRVWIKCRLVPLTFKNVEALFPLSKIFCSSFGLLVWFWLLWKVYIKTFGLVETPLPRFEERKKLNTFFVGGFPSRKCVLYISFEQTPFLFQEVLSGYKHWGHKNIGYKH